MQEARLEPGRRLGHFEILDLLGEGGMGAVYKARDHRLDRFVALKVLRADRLIDSDRRRRFVQEAKAASALNHPNIIVIHDIDCQDGLDYIVMEYVAGRTLDQLIPASGMRLEEMLQTALPLADALFKAHGAGILHRDLKPNNIIVATDGRPKLLDFGLAKLTERSELAASDATLKQGEQTAQGAILGTISYMSPEQAEGKKLDARSDIFSFGSMLYEMATGQRPFQGESPVSTLAKILNHEPKPAAELRAEIPRELHRVVARCMRKDPERRYQTMADVRNALEEVKEDSESGKHLASTVQGSRPTPKKRMWVAGLTAGLALIAAGAVWWAQRPKADASPLVVRALTSDSGMTTDPAISADGRLVAYASDRGSGKDLDIWVHPLTKGGEPVRLTSSEHEESSPALSPDGGLVSYQSTRDGGGIYVMPSRGGQERLLVRGGYFPRFSPDGNSIAYVASHTSSAGGDLAESQIYHIPVSGGTPQRIAPDLPFATAPVFSSDGQNVVFLGGPGANTRDETDWWVAPLKGGAVGANGGDRASPGQRRFAFWRAKCASELGA